VSHNDIRKLRERWASPAGESQARAALQALAQGGDVGHIGLGAVGDRIDLRGIVCPATASTDTVVGGVSAAVISNTTELHSAVLKDIDFSYSHLDNLRLHNCNVVGCRFDSASCEGWRVWGCDFSETSFRAANMRSAMLGPWADGRGNTYAGVDFDNADLRGAVCPAATFRDSTFAHARLDGIDFQSSTFIRCRFAGPLHDVIFWDRGFRIGKPDPNRMEDVDFSDAILRHVEFRRLDMDSAALPVSSDHLLLTDYRCALERALADLGEDDSPHGRRSRALLAHRLKWAGPSQRRGVFHRDDLGRTPDDANRLLRLLIECQRECGQRE
jgi:uncharacterized protein YjbI with pentapeptide repeats